MKFIKGLFSLVFLVLFMIVFCGTAMMAIPFGILLMVIIAAASDTPSGPDAVSAN